ncbi:MAG: COX15/CtaA family protein [Chloracidobacterium sp.]|uniref:COX15/CtaA family protein n=1 Tax=Chloracidobacterium validum TaxID=2821543 RepID=A0ABX8BEN4_9BACT|nr:COX15/CtaA family protein [Chloracidobacterium validum]QUW04360.1 COX15/CtaA family protein [Chloracidobacterium validum]
MNDRAPLTSSLAADARLRRFAWGVVGWNVLVIVWGAYVRASKSGDGCGSHWPLCNGEVVPPAGQFATFVEFMHRATSGIALLGVLGLVVWSFRRFAPGHIVRKAAVWSLVFILIEALIGALLVKLELVADNRSVARAVYMSVHLVNTFLLLGALTLTAYWISGFRPPRLIGLGRTGWWLLAAFASALVVGVTGAIAALGDTLFPASSLAQGIAEEFSGLAHFTVKLRWLHPVAAILSSAVIVSVAAKLRSSPATAPAALVVIAIVAVQFVLGLINVWLLAPIWMQLIHLFFADALWVALVLLAASALGSDATASDPLTAPTAYATT